MLTAANFQANYYLPKGSPDPVAAGNRLDRVVRDRLLTELKGRLKPSPADRNAVYRIHQLDIDLWVDVTGMGDTEIARIWSRLILQAVVRALMYGLPCQVVRYDDHAHYVAAFLSDLLAGHAWSRWVYDEFLPMRDLPVGQIAAFLLAPRPALLLPIARRLERDRRLESLVQRLQPADLSLIWEKGLGFGQPQPVLSVDSRLKGILSALQDRVALEQGDATAQARNTLRFYLAAAMFRPELAEDRALGAVCHHLALLHRVWTAKPAETLWTALANREILTLEALEPVLAGVDQTMAQARDWLVEVLASPEGRAYLAQLVPVTFPDVISRSTAGSTFSTRDTQQRTSKAKTPAAQDTRQLGASSATSPARDAKKRSVTVTTPATEDAQQSAAKTPAAQDTRQLGASSATSPARDAKKRSVTATTPATEDAQQSAAARVSPNVDQSSRCLGQVATAFAGLALLLPAIRELRLNEHVSKEGLYQLLLTVVGRSYLPLALNDAGPARLAGVPQQEMENARTLPVSWPDIAQWADPGETTQTAEQAADHLGPLPGSAFALLVLQRFVQGLRGFADSSPGYLAKQFINQSGHIKFTEKTIDVYLTRSPLGVVLHMAGRDGDQELIPWLDDRRLYIHLPDG